MSIVEDDSSRETSETPPSPSYPLLEKYCNIVFGKTLSEVSPQKILQFFDSKKLDSSNPDQTTYLPCAESIVPTLQELIKNDPKFLDNFSKSGFVATWDGVKIAHIDQNVDPKVADAIICGNIEIALKAAKECNLTIILGKYSGDEDVALICPNNLAKYGNSWKKAKDAFDTKLNQLRKEFYQQPYFAEARTSLQNAYPTEELGLKASYCKADEVYVYTPTLYNRSEDGNLTKKSQKYTPHPKQVFGSIIDSCAANLIALKEGDNTTNFLEYLIQTQKHDIDKYEQSYELDSIFPKDLEIRKIALLQSDLEQTFSENSSSERYLIRFADILVKYANKNQGHTMGDHHMIATARMMRRAISELNLDNHDIKIYQHQGSFVLTAPEEAYEKLSTLLNDPVSFNRFYAQNEDQRENLEGQDQNLRATPFVVATTQNISLTEGTHDLNPIKITTENIDLLWSKVEDLKHSQLINEVVSSLTASNLASTIIDQVFSDLTTINKLIGHSTMKFNELTKLLKNVESLQFASIFEYYSSQRPRQVDYVMDLLVSNKIIDRSSYRMFATSDLLQSP